MERMTGRRLKPLEFNYTAVFSEYEMNAAEFGEAVDWALQYWPSAPRYGVFLVEGDETSPTRIWHGYYDNVDKLYLCVYEDVEVGG